MVKAWGRFVWFVSGEWMLDGKPNGGDIIIARSVFASVLLFLGYIGLKHSLDPIRSWSFSLTELQKEAHASLPVLGALLAAVYASLYARFAAQWSYLAGLYNKLVEAELELTGNETDEQRRTFAYWRASFIEDAEELHLCTKRIFAPAIQEWLADAAVREAFLAGAIEGKQRLVKLENRLLAVTQPVVRALPSI